MRVKLIAALIICAALFHPDFLSAEIDSTAVKKATDITALSWRKDKKTAKKLLKKGKTEAAIPYLEAGAAKKPKKKYFPVRLAPAELTVRDYKASNKWYKVLVDKDSVKHKKPAYLFEYALTQKYLGQYEAAMATFAKYKGAAKDDDESVDMKKKAIRESLGCQKGIFFRDSVPSPAFKVKHLDGNINQPLADYSPVLKDGYLYFSSLRGDDAGSFARIYRAPKQGKDWGASEALPDNINAAGQNVGSPAFSRDGNTIYYTVCPTGGKCQIYKSTLTNGAWDKGVSAGIMINDPLYSNMQPAVGLNKDSEDVVYFVSDRNAGRGLDIFYSKITADGSLGKPRSAGPQINTKGDEVTPFFDFKTKTLYFSSNGWINIGGFDVFKTTWDANGDWTDPEDLGMPVNSSADDIGFSINDRSTLGYVVSNRPGGFGTKSETCCDDIYQVETTKLFLAARGSVYEEKDGSRALADHGLVLLYDEKNGTELGSYNLINGGYFFDLQPKVQYKLLSRKDGFYDAVSSFNTNDNIDNDTLQYDLFLKKKPDLNNPLIGRVIGRIYYDYDQSKLRPDSRDTLRAVMDIMNQFPNLVIEIGAHTDGKGSETYNLFLSKKRADAVMNYYIYDKKVSKDRLVSKAYGTSQPAASNTTPDGKDNPTGRALNRRTEFKVLGEIKPEDKAPKTGKADKVENELAAPAKKAAPEAKVTKKDNAPAVKVIKRDIAIGKKTAASPTIPSSPTVASATPAPAKSMSAPDGQYKSAPDQSTVISGKVYLQKAGKNTLANQAAVFLTTNEGGFQQKVYYVKADGSYSFDISRAAADTFKLIARKYQFESNEVVLTKAGLQQSNKPIDLSVLMK
jgi:outer membrane protein OmpA-like peptidoglycan-associated protein